MLLIMKKLLAVSAVLFLLAGCSVTTTIKKNDKKVYEVKSGRYAVILYENKKDDVKIKIDNRGHKSGFLLVLPALISKTPDISIEQDD